MPQPVWQTDQIQIEPGTTGSRLIARDTVGTDNALRLTDPLVTATLSQLIGLRNITGLAIVGRAGDGAPYTAVQDAIDEAPLNASAALPHVIAIYSGRYEENLVIEKDGLVLVGLGGVVLANPAATADATITVQEGATVPLDLTLQNIRVENGEIGERCVHVNGTDTFADGTATVGTAPLAATDTLTIGGVALTGVAGARASGSDNFSVDGLTTTAIAAEIVAAINDVANSFAVTVSAFSVGALVTITAVAAGAGGNAITLVSATTPIGNLPVSGAALTGGGTPPTLLSGGGLKVLDCELLATGVGGYQIDATIANNIEVRGGSWAGSSSTSLCRVNQCAAFYCDGVRWTNKWEFAYDSGGTLPSIATSAYELSNLARCEDFTVGLIGVGSLSVLSCPRVGAVVAGGDLTVLFSHCRLGALTLSDTVAVTLVECGRGAASTGGGTPTLAESMVVGSTAFTGAPASPAFGVPQPDTAYEVFLSPSVPTDTYAVTAKATTSFTITSAGGTPATIGYTIARQL